MPKNPAPKYSIAWDSKRSGEQQRKQYETFTSYKRAKAEADRMNKAMTVKGVGRFVVIEL